MAKKVTPKTAEPTVPKTPRKRVSNKAPKDFNVLKAIRSEPNYKTNVKRRDYRSRKYVTNNYSTKGKLSIMPGQLIMFNYFEPKTKEKLQYYDAMPCTIFFGIINTKDGIRVLGFNIHYYPPRIRFQLMNRIYEIYKPIYEKNFNYPLKEELSTFNYKNLISQLQKAKLDFGIREYIPKLMTKITPIPVAGWSKAVLTEGHFKKETREQILNYWKDKASGIETPKKTKKPITP